MSQRTSVSNVFGDDTQKSAATQRGEAPSARYAVTLNMLLNLAQRQQCAHAVPKLRKLFFYGARLSSHLGYGAIAQRSDTLLRTAFHSKHAVWNRKLQQWVEVPVAAAPAEEGATEGDERAVKSGETSSNAFASGSNANRLVTAASSCVQAFTALLVLSLLHCFKCRKQSVVFVVGPQSCATARQGVCYSPTSQ
jgi:hypothetical protein